jgi:pyridoxamine 5'-phosphate oxidase
MNTEPDFYNDLNLSFDKAWQIIEPGATQRISAAHTPVVATIGTDGLPQQRIMVLREADRAKRFLRFHTDARSTKIGEVRSGALASVLMYDPVEKMQLRLTGFVTVQTDGEGVDDAWLDSTVFARRCYMAEHAPGDLAEMPTSGLPDWIEGKKPVESDLIDARANFALLWLEIGSIEWLYLANAGHRRARWQWDDAIQNWSGRWLVP